MSSYNVKNPTASRVFSKSYCIRVLGTQPARKGYQTFVAILFATLDVKLQESELLQTSRMRKQQRSQVELGEAQWPAPMLKFAIIL